MKKIDIFWKKKHEAEAMPEREPFDDWKLLKMIKRANANAEANLEKKNKNVKR